MDNEQELRYNMELNYSLEEYSREILRIKSEEDTFEWRELYSSMDEGSHEQFGRDSTEIIDDMFYLRNQGLIEPAEDNGGKESKLPVMFSVSEELDSYIGDRELYGLEDALDRPVRARNPAI